MANLSPDDDGFDTDRNMVLAKVTRVARYCDCLNDLLNMRDDAFACAILAKATSELQEAIEAAGPLKSKLKKEADEARERLERAQRPRF